MNFLAIMAPFFNRKKRVTLADGLREAISESKSQLKRVLIVDDDYLFCNLMEQLMEKAFFATLTAVGTASAARALLTSGECFDAVILDSRLTNGKGVALYAEILKNRPELHVVFLTGYDSQDFRAEVEAVGPARVFQKTSAMRTEFLEQLFYDVGLIKRPVAE